MRNVSLDSCWVRFGAEVMLVIFPPVFFFLEEIILLLFLETANIKKRRSVRKNQQWLGLGFGVLK